MTRNVICGFLNDNPLKYTYILFIYDKIELEILTFFELNTGQNCRVERDLRGHQVQLPAHCRIHYIILSLKTSGEGEETSPHDNHSLIDSCYCQEILPDPGFLVPLQLRDGEYYAEFFKIVNSIVFPVSLSCLFNSWKSNEL